MQAAVPVQEVTKYPHATFSWVDLSTTDQDAAKRFYTNLFGWTTEDIPMGDGAVYTMFQLHGKSVAAVSTMPQQMKDQGIPPHWNSYVTVDNVDEFAPKVEAAGGTLMMEPFDVMDSGRMALFQDPTGAVCAAWEAKNHVGASYVNTPNTLVWNELQTNDAQKAGDFYSTIFGWTKQTDSDAGYTMFVNGERMAGGLLQMDESMAGVPPHWAVYFAVENCAAAAENVKALGGTVLFGPIEIPGGRFVVAQDPQGGTFVLMRMDEVDPPPQG